MNFIYAFAKQFIWNKYLKNGFQNYEIKKNNCIIDYWDNNNKDAKVVILLHGFGAQAEFQWYKQVGVLAKKNRVIIPNLLYFGKTRQANKYKLQDQVNLLNILAKNLNIEKYDLVGISYGGLIAIEHCNQNVEKVEKLVLIDSPIKFFTNVDLEKINNIYKLNSIDELFAPTDYFGLKKQFKAAFYYEQFIPTFIYKLLYKELCFPNIENWRKLILELKSDLELYSSREYRFDQLTLLIWGEHDDIVPPRIGLELNSYLKFSRIEIIEKSKHLPNIEQSNRFNKLLIDFLSKGC